MTQAVDMPVGKWMLITIHLSPDGDKAWINGERVSLDQAREYFRLGDRPYGR